MDNVKKLTEALGLLETLPCAGKENMARMLMAMQRIAEVAAALAEGAQAAGKEG